MAFEIGSTIGPYQIITQLGQGGMATVYKAYHASLDRYVALKVLHAVFSRDDTYIERFEREARLVARLDHPNIVPIYDYSEYEGYPYLVMRFIEGDTLKARLKQRPLSAQEISDIVISVGGALHAAHREGVLHRDVKPSNIMLDRSGKIYLTDFGLARMAQSGESTLSKDMMLGTPQYISPEQARGDRKLDAGTDIYSLGVVVYEMVAGRVPFSADTPYAIIHDHIFSPLPLPSLVNPEIPGPVERFLLKALAKDRRARFESVEQMVAAYLAAANQVGDQAIEAASAVRPAPASRPAAPTQPGAVPASTSPAEGKAAARRQRRSSARSRSGLWPLAGIILLVILLVAVGLVLNQAITEEAQHIFIDSPAREGSWYILPGHDTLLL